MENFLCVKSNFGGVGGVLYSVTLDFVKYDKCLPDWGLHFQLLDKTRGKKMNYLYLCSKMPKII